MIGNCACVYLCTITNGFNPAYLENQYWPVPLYLFTTGVVALSVQMFLVIRYWKLTKNILVAPIIFLFVLVAAGGSFTCGVTIAMYPAFAQRDKVKIPATIWLVTEALAELAIALTLIWEFRKAGTAFKDTRRYLLNNESNVPVGIAYCLGRIYILTMLANLNIRQTGRTGSSRGTTSTMQRAQAARSDGTEDYGGIRAFHMSVWLIWDAHTSGELHRTALFHIDNVRPEYSGPFRPHADQMHALDGPNAEIEMTVKDSVSYSSKKKRDLFTDMARLTIVCDEHCN
ncbi:hypothetical protein MSAN_00332700 [Mycena sanguinolenta]|uniref:Uncharacterized protein n=1 Tax=Mycena sanguinolenta TaxID=230812 RepID=A0A8H7DGE8_9AGAR|nr:hypothetical protein MSAN_00332700 [Mycena sanguinolenta]